MPENRWPKCAHPFKITGAKDAVTDIEVLGNPNIMQSPVLLPDGKTLISGYFYLAFRPLRLDTEGRAISMKAWTVRCGPPAPAKEATAGSDDVAEDYDPSLPVITSPTDPSSVTRVDTPSEAELAAYAARQAKLKSSPVQPPTHLTGLNGYIARTEPTKSPLPGLTMQGDYCLPDSIEALRNAARESEAWADDDPMYHWVRDLKPSDELSPSLEALLDTLRTSKPSD
jgi:hypothetical protein